MSASALRFGMAGGRVRLVGGGLAGRQLQLGHQLVVDNGEHLFQFVHVLGRKALAHALDDGKIGRASCRERV